MTKKGFTLMELLVSIFISGMVMLSLVAMWKTSSNHTAQAQRQSIIKNENTIFLRKLYSDFVSASEIICPWGHSTGGPTNCSSKYIAVKEAVIDPDDHSKLIRITKNVCGASNNAWASDESLTSISSRCIKPSYVVYVREGENVYRCRYNFLDGTDETISINTLVNNASCTSSNTSREIAMPYVTNFVLQMSNSGSDLSPELSIDYTIHRDFGGDIPPVHFRFKRLLTLKRGV